MRCRENGEIIRVNDVREDFFVAIEASENIGSRCYIVSQNTLCCHRKQLTTRLANGPSGASSDVCYCPSE